MRQTGIQKPEDRLLQAKYQQEVRPPSFQFDLNITPEEGGPSLTEEAHNLILTLASNEYHPYIPDHPAPNLVPLPTDQEDELHYMGCHDINTSYASQGTLQTALKGWESLFLQDWLTENNLNPNEWHITLVGDPSCDHANLTRRKVTNNKR